MSIARSDLVAVLLLALATPGASLRLGSGVVGPASARRWSSSQRVQLPVLRSIAPTAAPMGASLCRAAPASSRCSADISMRMGGGFNPSSLIGPAILVTLIASGAFWNILAFANGVFLLIVLVPLVATPLIKLYLSSNVLDGACPDCGAPQQVLEDTFTITTPHHYTDDSGHGRAASADSHPAQTTPQ